MKSTLTLLVLALTIELALCGIQSGIYPCYAGTIDMTQQLGGP